MPIYPGSENFKPGPNRSELQLRLYPADTNTNEPTGGLLSVWVAGPKMQAQVATTATAATQNITAICVQGKYSYDAWHKPGRVAPSGDRAGSVGFGGRSSTIGWAALPANTVLKSFLPILPGDTWVMERKDATAVTLGTSYGYDVVTGLPVVDATNTTNVAIRVLAYYEPDILAGRATTACRLVVEAVNANGHLMYA